MSTPLRVLGISEKKQKAYEAKGFKNAEDLIKHLPRRYDDLSDIKTVAEVKHKEFGAVIGVVVKSKEGITRDGRGYVSFTCKDRMEEAFWVTVFGPKNDAYRKYPIGKEILIAGKWSISYKDDKRYVSLGTPMYVEQDIRSGSKIHTVYKKVHPQISHEDFKAHVSIGVNVEDMYDFLEPELYFHWKHIDTSCLEYPLMPRNKSYRAVHQPQSQEEILVSKYRIAFDDLFHLSYRLSAKTPVTVKERVEPIILPKLDLSREFIKSLPFKLTSGQFEVLRDMMQRVQTGKQLTALVQGDVGCGKTLVAIIMMLCHVENGFQAGLMAPTSVLAKQHALEIEKLLGAHGFKVVCLTGDLKAKERKEILKQVESGEAHFIVGTHAILSEKIKFNNLGLFITDEEHKFGVKQREAIKVRIQEQAINFVSMTATPIPRTLAGALYDDNIQTYSIKALPAGRQPIVTNWINNQEQIADHLVHEVAKGRQGYFICPIIEENEKMDGVMDIKGCEKWIKNHPKLRHLRVGVATGKMAPEVMKEQIMRFKNMEFDVLLATTVVEVGVNVPNATLITILSADRFGLAQLHQLRGRVGRGSHASYCYLVAENPTPNGQKKLQAMCESTDGFYLSEVDLMLRGAGDLVGDNQTGFENTFLLLLKYPALFEKIQREMANIFANEQRLSHYSKFFKD